MRVLIAVTNDEATLDAIEFAHKLVPGTATKLVLNVARGLDPDERSDGVSDEQSFVDWKAHKITTRIALTFVDATRLIEYGDPGDVICDVARSEKVDLIVLGTHDRGVWQSLWAPSVSDYVAHHAHCSVLIVR